jgi:hypothetical protein
MEFHTSLQCVPRFADEIRFAPKGELVSQKFAPAPQGARSAGLTRARVRGKTRVVEMSQRPDPYRA